MAQQNETTLAKCSWTSCMWTCFGIGSYTMPRLWQSAHSNFIGSRVYACLNVTCHLHFWQNDWGLSHAPAITQGWNRHWIRVSTQSWLWRRKFSFCSCRHSNLQPFDHESGTLTNKLSILSWSLSVVIHGTSCSSSLDLFNGVNAASKI